jgi:hypothetical protein
MKKALLILFLLVAFFESNSQSLIIDKQFVQANNIQSVTFFDLDLFESIDLESGVSGQNKKVVITYDENGYLTNITKLLIQHTDTLSNVKTVFVYTESKLFLTVSQERVCSEPTQTFFTDTGCLPQITFKIYKTDSATNTISYRKYIADDDLDYYFSCCVFNKNIFNKTIDMYLREMKWMEDVKNIHHINETTAQTMQNEIFIHYTFTSDDCDEIIDEETGDTTVICNKGWYEFSMEEFEEEMELPTTKSEIGPVNFTANQFAINTSRKTTKNKINKSNEIIIVLPDYNVKLIRVCVKK